VSNDEFRVTGRQPTFPMGDPNSPILQPWASDAIRKRNDLIISGNPVFLPRASCWPLGVTEFLLVPMTTLSEATAWRSTSPMGGVSIADAPGVNGPAELGSLVNNEPHKIGH
jgi:hypothetical protein